MKTEVQFVKIAVFIFFLPFSCLRTKRCKVKAIRTPPQCSATVLPSPGVRGHLVPSERRPAALEGNRRELSGLFHKRLQVPPEPSLPWVVLQSALCQPWAVCTVC